MTEREKGQFKVVSGDELLATLGLGQRQTKEPTGLEWCRQNQAEHMKRAERERKVAEAFKILGDAMEADTNTNLGKALAILLGQE